jgi:hypothetical protein
MTESVGKTRPPALGSQLTLQFAQLSLGTAVIIAAVLTAVHLPEEHCPPA